MYEATIRVFYPLEEGVIVLRTERNWKEDIEPENIDWEKNCFQFNIKHENSILSYKPCIRRGDETIWSKGANKMALLHKNWPMDVYPYFFSEESGEITDVIEVPSEIYDYNRLIRVYLPSGYYENRLKCYPIIYMHDGQNLFFPQEAFLGQDWNVEGNIDLLNSMNLIEQIIVVGIHHGDRFQEFCYPDYERYGNCIVDEIKPWVDCNFRTLFEPWHTCVMGSSLGGVVSFYLAWEWPDVFGTCACMSSPFFARDNLLERVENDDILPRAHSRFYLDSGWPCDNYDTTVKMATALLDKGFQWGYNFIHLAYPHAKHTESEWAARLHIPLQLFFGRIRRAHMHFLDPNYRWRLETVCSGEEIEM